MPFEQLRKQWLARDPRAPLQAALIFVEGWLVLGAGTRLASAKPDTRLEANDDGRVSTLLGLAYERPLEHAALRHIRRAIVKHGGGDAMLASIHLAMTGLWPLRQPKQAAYRLFMGDGLMKAGVPTGDLMRALGLDPALIDRIEKYSPDQPRVPAGNGRPSGRWTRDGAGGAAPPAAPVALETTRDRGARDEPSGGSAPGSNDGDDPADISVAIRQPSEPVPVLSDANPEPTKLRQQFAQIAIGKIPHKGDPRIDSTTNALVDLLAFAASSIPKGVGPLYGTALHVAFANAVRTANLPGIGPDGVEQSFDLDGVAKYGVAGSIRTDVSLWDDAHENVIAIYDLKTGAAQLSDARISQLRSMATRSGSADAPTVFELRLELRKSR